MSSGRAGAGPGPQPPVPNIVERLSRGDCSPNRNGSLISAKLTGCTGVFAAWYTVSRRLNGAGVVTVYEAAGRGRKQRQPPRGT